MHHFVTKMCTQDIELVHCGICAIGRSIDNNNNKNIEKFIDEISPIIDIIQKENSYAAIAGDFNINLLQVSEREKHVEFNSSNTHCKTIAEFDWSDIL